MSILRCEKCILLLLTGALLLGSGCAAAAPRGTMRAESYRRPEATATALPSATPTATITLVMVPLAPFARFDPPQRTEFDRPGALLVTISPGSAQWADLFLVDPGTGGLECVTCPAGQEMESNGYYAAPHFSSPAWSPDGSRYAFAFRSVQHNGILVRTADSPLVELLGGAEDWFADPAWSPDGGRIAYARGPLRGEGYGSNQLCVLEIDSARTTCIAEEKANRFPAWSPDGNSILFSSGDHIYSPVKPMDLFRWDLASGDVVQVTDTPVSEILAQWSPDGAQLACIRLDPREDPPPSGLVLAAANGSAPSLLAGTENTLDFAWSPDGGQIIFTQTSPIANEACTMDCLPYTILKLLDLETGEILPLSDGMQWVGDPAWRP
jgi:Tol biopolymer transport system component